MDKSYRIHTNISSDTRLNVNMQQDFDFLEVLSLKLKKKDAYRLHSSNYGVIVGRVLANDAFGIPNAKVSVFIEKTDGDSVDMETIYPYKEVTTKDKDGRRYNILPDYSDDECYRVVGTFPNKRLVLDDDVQLDVYDKYWKYSTVTNNAGDFMLFAVPTGSVTVHIEMDLSDIGVLSQKPRDFEYKGYNLTLFDSPSQFKESTNLDDLAQIFSQNKSIFVYPFWGDADNGVACITRSDVQIQYQFEPTCVFMGSIVSDNEGHAIGHNCAPDIDNGMNNQLVGGNGTIEMIRKTSDGLVEEYSIQGNQLIDEDGVWCYQIPMNLDYIGTDEYGNIVPTDNPNKGIPTRTQVRFRFSKNETSDEGFSRHTAKYLVPMNPVFSESATNMVDLDNGVQSLPGEIPVIPERGSDIEKMYTFGSATPISCFRDLYWNNVYSVKNYIPKVQVAHRAHAKNYGALKGSNLAEDQNPIPFNKLRIDMPFLYMVVCILYTIMVWVVKIINMIISFLHRLIYETCLPRIPGIGRICPLRWIGSLLGDLSCITMSAGSDEGNVAYYPGCSSAAMKHSSCPEDMKEEGCEKRSDDDELMDKIQRNLAQEFKIVKLDLYQDWINGCLYMPLWYWKKRKKRTFLFFTLSRAKNDYCSSNRNYGRLKTYVTCNIKYLDNSLTVRNNRDSMPDNEARWHKNRKNQIRYNKGLIKPVENRDGLTVYYYAAVQPTSNVRNSNEEMERLPNNISAVRLYATDIILLGNLDPNNIYGIPQFFKCLPSTTANIPPIATIEEIKDPNQQNGAEDDLKGSDDSGDTVTTGMDWNHDGGSQFPTYKTGLFMDLACTYAATRPKSCINVERLSELGVSLDLRHKMAYHEGGTDTLYGDIDTDGFISKYELDDMENRAMFATLNHIGFIPQEYQDMYGYYTTQIHDANTNYLIPKFKYVYPVDFDGRLQLPMELYNTNRNRFRQALFDERDESYLTFRLGAENSRNYTRNSEGRIRHFYHTNLLDMPLYNNSYYFYFGINKGKTAIDKFNKLFYAPCTRNNKMPFTLNITTQGRSYCPEAYIGRCDLERNQTRCPGVTGNTLYSNSSDNKKNNAYGYIKVESDDIRMPYSYVLYDSFGNEVISEDEMTLGQFVIGGDIDDNNDIVLNCNGEVRYQNSPCNRLTRTNQYGEEENVVLDNQEYILEVTDSDGKTISERVKMDIPKINGEYWATRLGAKFYNSATTRIDYICNDNNAYYGTINTSGFTVDGYKCHLTDVEYIGYANDIEYIDFDGTRKTETDDTKGRYVFSISGSSEDISDNVQAYIEVGVFKSTQENLVRNCLCDNNESADRSDDDDRPINLIKEAQDSEENPVAMQISGARKNHFFLGFNNGVMTIYLYQPNRYNVTITQNCNGRLIESNTSTEIVDVLNGEPFITYLNTMPTKFMLGTVNDNRNADIARSSYFYNNVASIEPVLYGGNTITDKNNNGSYHLKGWYGTHQEDSYMFSRREENKTYNYNQSVWEDMFSSTKDDIASPKMKRYILKFKFDKMFKLSEGTYIVKDSSRRFTFQSTGGINPILYRSVAPFYEDPQRVGKSYVLKDGFTTTCIEEYPNIVGKNYSRPLMHDYSYTPGFDISDSDNGAHFNAPIYGTNSIYLGNYFAAFTRDGAYISKNTIDGKNISIARSPSFASISPTDTLKIKGQDLVRNIGQFSLAHTMGTQTLRPNPDMQRNVLPYLRALYIDRRFDYDLVFLAPAVGNNFSLYKAEEDGRDRPWKGGRVSGWTYNGIEMSYDSNYNIISAHIHQANTTSVPSTGDGTESGVDGIEYTAATFNKRLEYTYKYDCADLCMTCGHQEKNMGEICPHCGSSNINHFHGENGTNIDENSIVSVPELTTDSEGRNPGEEGYEPTYEMNDVSSQTLSNHDFDTTNFCNGNIPQVILNGNVTRYTLDDAITYYHGWYGDERYDWDYTDTTACAPDLYDNTEKKAPRWGNWNNIYVRYTVESGDTIYVQEKNFGYNVNVDGDEESPETEMIPLFKEFFTSELAGLDIRHLYWSLFNHFRLRMYTTGDTANIANQQIGGFGVNAINNLINPFYVYHYPALDAFLRSPNTYNGDFNREDVVNPCHEFGKRAYPTRRYIDVGNLPSTTYYNYDVSSCSYNINSVINDDGTITAETEEGEKTNIAFNWSSPISVVTPNGASKEYANVTYQTADCNDNGTFANYMHFTASTASLMFKYTPYTCDGFDVYTKSPRLVQVLPYIEVDGVRRNIDGIGYYKTSNPSTEFGDGEFGSSYYGDGKNLDDAISDITLVNGTFTDSYHFVWDKRGPTIVRNILLPENVSTSRGYITKYGLSVNTNGNVFFKKGDDFLTSDDDDFTNIIFNRDDITLRGEKTKQDVKVFTVLVDREYQLQEDDNLVKHIRSIETSDLFDCRDLYMKVTLSGQSSETDVNESGLTYVEMRRDYQEDISAASVDNGSISTGTEHKEEQTSCGDTVSFDVQTTNLGPDTRVGEDSTRIFSQTITFDMAFDARESTEVPDRQNEAFADYSMMSYTFRFTSAQNEEFDVTPSEVFLIDNGTMKILRFIIRWSTDMGILADKKWTGDNQVRPVPVSIYARTASNFIYKLTNFNIQFCCDSGGQQSGTSGGCGDVNTIKKSMEEGERYISHISIGNCPCQ